MIQEKSYSKAEKCSIFKVLSLPCEVYFMWLL